TQHLSSASALTTLSTPATATWTDQLATMTMASTAAIPVTSRRLVIATVTMPITTPIARKMVLSATLGPSAGTASPISGATLIRKNMNTGLALAIVSFREDTWLWERNRNLVQAAEWQSISGKAMAPSGIFTILPQKNSTFLLKIGRAS